MDSSNENNETFVDPATLSITRDSSEGFVHTAARAPLETPGGRPVGHPSSRLLEHILREIAAHQSVDPGRLGPYSFYSTQMDFVEHGQDAILNDFENILRQDPLLHRGAGPEQVDQLHYWYFVVNFLSEGDCKLPVVPSEGGFYTEAHRENFERVSAYVLATYSALPAESRTLIINLSSIHGAGILLPLMLITGRCSGEEYGEALLGAQFVHPSLSWWGIGDPDWDAFKENLQAIKQDAYTALEYAAHYYDESQNRIRALIKSGESTSMEFKATLRHNLESNTKDSAIEHSALKTICGFLNTDGGTLLIGVSDTGSIVGIEADGFGNRDRFALHFTQIVRQRLGQGSLADIRNTFETLEGHDVFEIRVSRASQPIFLRFGKSEDEFFVRTGPQTVKLEVREALEYARRRFGE
jgi:chaperone required for assembly of F1-ATPase